MRRHPAWIATLWGLCWLAAGIAVALVPLLVAALAPDAIARVLVGVMLALAALMPLVPALFVRREWSPLVAGALSAAVAFIDTTIWLMTLRQCSLAEALFAPVTMTMIVGYTLAAALVGWLRRRLMRDHSSPQPAA